jgi:GDP-4-dehydro-6-deoxy-D-mannose reductase
LKFFITGANGFIGSNFIRNIVNDGSRVLAAFNNSSEKVLEHKNIEKIFCPISEISKFEKKILDFDPDIVLHLAAQSSPSISMISPINCLETNILGSLELFKILRKIGKNPKTILFSSSAVYSKTQQKKIINEKYPTNPVSIYGISKLIMEELGIDYFERHKMNIICVRPFFLIGPEKDDDFCSAIAQSVIKIEKGIKKNVEVGNLNLVKDFLDIEDGISAILKIVSIGRPGEIYNICSGKGYSLKEVFNIFQKYSKKNLSPIVNEQFKKDIDSKFRIGSSRKIESLGWKQKIDIESSIEKIIEFWRRESEK